MIAAARLFFGMGAFGLVAGGIYITVNRHDPELAGFGLLMTFFIACLFIGSMLWSASPANRRRTAAPDTGLPGSAHPDRGAADEHGNIHHMAPTLAPAVYSLAGTVLVAALVFRHKAAIIGPGGIGFGLVLFLTATAIWYRAVAVDTRAKLSGGHAVHLVEHGEEAAAEAPPGPPGPANYFEQLREAFEVGDPDWAAAAYAPGAVYYEPANPPHEGRESIRAYLNDLLKGHPGLQYTVERMGVDGDTAIVEWTWSFRRGARRVSDQSGVTVLQVGPDGIVYHRDYL
ncbi:MAG TPA: nuclear transport factor 2 family protein [Actinomycetes bacterium]